jgi:hypothetical protein
MKKTTVVLSTLLLLSQLKGRLVYWYAATLTVCMVFAAACCGFHQLHNDFWDCVFIARHLTLNDLQSLFNPQYPIGYTLFLKSIGGHGLPVTPAIIANCAFAGIMLLAVGWFLVRFLPGRAAAVAIVLLAFFPRLFHYTTVGGGDPGSVGLFTVGAALILSDIGLNPERSKGLARPLIGGLFLGLAALFRYHVFVGGAIFLFALGLVYRKEWPRLVMAAIGLGLAYSPQWIINVLTGHGLFKTQFGPMNVYDLMYSLNWYRSTSLNLPSSVMTIILSNPWLFVHNYAVAFLKFSPAWLLPLMAAITAKERYLKKTCVAIFLWALCYFTLFSATTSGRQILLVLPLTFFSIAVLLHTAWHSAGRDVRLLKYVVPLMVLGALAIFLQRDVHKIIERAGERTACSMVESRLKSRGCTSVRQVFATDYDIYFKSMPPYTLLSNGGAPRWGTFGVQEELPEFPVDTPGVFAEVCRKRDVRFLVLTSEADKYSSALGALYATDQSDYFTHLGTYGRFSVFEATSRE